MKANKQGISLIVLIITIVVIIILAAAIILNLSNTNIIDNAHKGVAANDLAEIQSAVNLKMGDMFVTTKGVRPTPEQILDGLKEGEGEDQTVLVKGLKEDLPDLKIGTTDSKDVDYVLGTDLVVKVSTVTE